MHTGGEGGLNSTPRQILEKLKKKKIKNAIKLKMGVLLAILF
jgi:hypothetical protein